MKRVLASMPDHRGLATWGERIVPLDEFAAEVLRHGRHLGEDEREAARCRLLGARSDACPVEGPLTRAVVFGGVYSNHFALRSLIEASRRRGFEALYCLGDLGGFGPHPEKVWPLLEAAGVRCIQGNYEESLSSGREDCNCGYTDPRDNHFAARSYAYTAARCSEPFRAWMGRLPRRRRIRIGQRELLLVHGSARRINEFLFRSTSSVSFLERLLDQECCDGMLCSHTGLPWYRRLPSGRDVVNVGVIGRPANDGRTEVWYASLEARGAEVECRLRPLAYDHLALAGEMREERLPQEFVETILSGFWTTCLEILPARERAISRY